MKNNYVVFVLFLMGIGVMMAQEKQQHVAKATEYGRAQFLGIVPSFAEQKAKGTLIYGTPNEVKIYNPKVDSRNKDWRGNIPAKIQKETHYTNVQTTFGRKAIRAPLSEWETVQAGATPTDPTGAVGPNHYISSYNSSFSIWSLTGTQLLANASLATLWAGETKGDPIVFYDQFAQRFVITQFSDTPNGFLVAVCKGNDPVNDGWYAYRFNTVNPATFPDYPKFSVWSDGYYITANKDQGSPTTSEVVYVLERDKMICGETAQYVGFPLTNIVINGFYSPGGASVLGYTMPPTGKFPIFYLQDNAWTGITNDHIKVWEVDVNWVTTASSTISQTQTLGLADGVTAFDNLFDAGSFSNLPQPGGGGDIDALQATMMYMTSYRMFGTHNSVVMNFVIDTDGNDNLAGIRWYELRQTSHGQPWTVYQEGTYAPADGLSRFCGSMSIDGNGHIGLGFTSVSAASNPALRFTGRMQGDALGSMTVAEDIMESGNTGNPATRYGDYAQTTVSPTDNRTFWYTGEIFKTGGSATRRNHVGTYKIGTDPAISVGVFDLQAPILAGSPTQTISVTLKNYGTTSQGNFPVRYTIDGGTPVTETYTGTLAAGATDTFNFATTADMSIAGQTYQVDVRTTLGTDTFAPDDGFTIPVKAVFQNDVGVVGFVAPVSGASLTNSETVTVILQNFGINAQSGFNVQYTVNGGGAVTETFAGTLNPGTTQNFTFATTADLSSGTIFTMCGQTLLGTDQDSSNDQFCTNIVASGCTPAATGGCNLDGIKRFVLGTIDVDNGGTGCNSTGAIQGFVDRTSLVTNLDRASGNNTHTLRAQHAWAAAPANAEQISVWIDFNDNGTFEASERLITGGTFPAANSLVDFNLTIPTSANLGTHILRARCIDTTGSPGDVNDPCADKQFGETHDYLVNIIDSVLDLEEDTITDNNFSIVYLEDVDEFNVSLESRKYKGTLLLTVFNLSGQRVLETTLDDYTNGKYEHNLNLSANSAGLYFVTLGNGEVSLTKKIVVR